MGDWAGYRELYGQGTNHWIDREFLVGLNRRSREFDAKVWSNRDRAEVAKIFAELGRIRQMSFTSGGGIGGNKGIGEPPPPWVGCLIWIVILTGVLVLVLT
jgi:hypothetical protein